MFFNVVSVPRHSDDTFGPMVCSQLAAAHSANVSDQIGSMRLPRGRPFLAHPARRQPTRPSSTMPPAPGRWKLRVRLQIGQTLASNKCARRQRRQYILRPAPPPPPHTHTHTQWRARSSLAFVQWDARARALRHRRRFVTFSHAQALCRNNNALPSSAGSAPRSRVSCQPPPAQISSHTHTQIS